MNAVPGEPPAHAHRSSEVTQIVIVGGGIAGGALATALASAGGSVVVLEATTVFVDRVRGESMMPWGVAEAARLGVKDVLLDAGAHIAPSWKRYSEGESQPREIPVGLLVPGVAGTLNLEHRRACQALLDAAASAGATVVRGARNMRVQPGAQPRLTFDHGNANIELQPDIVIGADGRSSHVRRACGITLEQQPAAGAIAGMLLDNIDRADDADTIVEHDLGLFLLLHQSGRRARAYHVVPVTHRKRYAGSDGPAVFLHDAASATRSVGTSVANARPIGPCATFLGTDTWTDRPGTDGVILIGDAAGHNDPAAGCGLSIAMRDARLVRDLILDGARAPTDFSSYFEERLERMRRLRLIADLVNAASVEPAENRSARRALFAAAMSSMDPIVFPLIVGMFAGPETIPAPATDAAVLDLIRAGSLSTKST